MIMGFVGKLNRGEFDEVTSGLKSKVKSVLSKTLYTLIGGLALVGGIYYRDYKENMKEDNRVFIAKPNDDTSTPKSPLEPLAPTLITPQESLMKEQEKFQYQPYDLWEIQGKEDIERSERSCSFIYTPHKEDSLDSLLKNSNDEFINLLKKKNLYLPELLEKLSKRTKTDGKERTIILNIPQKCLNGFTDNVNKNREKAISMSGKDFSEMITYFGDSLFLQSILGITKGEFPSDEKKKDNIMKHYSIFEEVAKKYSKGTGYTPEQFEWFLATIAYTKSGGEQFAVSKEDEVGLMGIILDKFEDSKYKTNLPNPLNIEEAVDFRAEILKKDILSYKIEYDKKNLIYMALMKYDLGDKLDPLIDKLGDDITFENIFYAPDFPRETHLYLKNFSSSLEKTESIKADLMIKEKN
jgi:hypothetical protein